MTRDPRPRAADRVSRVLLAQPLPPAARAAIVGVAALIVFGVGFFDYAAGQRLSLSVFYLVPVTAVAALIGSRAAYLLAVESALVWVAAEGLVQREAEVTSSAVNALLRGATLTVVVGLVSALRRAVEEAHTATQAAQGFLSTAAHQLRTPVTGLVVIAEAAATEVDPARREQLQARLEESTTRVSRLLGLLLQMARLDQGQAVRSQLIDLETLIAREVEIAKSHFPGVGFTLSAGCRTSIHGDAHSLGEAVSNLLDNAGRHARSQVVVRVGSERAGSVLVDITDDGPGVPLGMEEAIFERFVSLDGDGGSGLGLPIARAAASMHGGTLCFRNGFRLELPTAG